MAGKTRRSDRLTKAEFARKVGAAPSTIQRMCADGRLSVHKDGSVKMPGGLAEYRAARAAVAAPGATGEASELRKALQQAQVRERIAKAEARELQLRRERDELVEVAEVHADARAAGELIRTQLLALPARVALAVEAIAAGPAGAPRAAQIEAVIADEINAALDVLHKTRFGATAQ